MNSVQSSEVVDECVDTQDMRPSNGVKRKRQCSQASSDSDQTPPHKKTAPCDVPEQGESAVVQQLNNDNVETDNNEDLDENVFSLEHFCDEVLYEIFKFLDTWSLMTLMNVSKRFEKFVLDKRLWEVIDLSQEPLPLGILEDMLERSHEKTLSIKLMGPSPSQHIELEIRHFNKTLRNSLTTRCTKLTVMELFSVTLDFNQLSFKDFPASLKRLVLNNCNVRIGANRSIFSGIEIILVNLVELAIENNAWFDPYYIMPIAKLPSLKYLSLKGCSQMEEFIPYGSIAGRHGFKQLEVLDLSDTPLNDSDLQCFNTVETLKEIYLQCPEEVIKALEQVNNDAATTTSTPPTNQCENETEQPSTSSGVKIKLINGSPSAEANASSSSSSADNDNPSTSAASSKDCNESIHTASPESAAAAPASVAPASAEPASVAPASAAPASAAPAAAPPAALPSNVVSENAPCDAAPPAAAAGSNQPSTASSANSNSSRNVIALVGSNAPSRSRFLPRPDHIIYLDCRNRISPHAFHISLRDRYNIREPRMVFHRHSGRRQQRSPPPPAFEQMIRHNLFWDIINPLGRAAGGGGPDRLFGEENEVEYGGANVHHNPFNNFYNSRPRGSISDRGVCCFGRTREPVQRGVIWIRFNNRPIENRFERFSVRDYKSVTDTSLEHLVQCSPHLVFLDVSGTSVTLKGVRLFKEVKPECKVVAEHLLSQVL